MANEYIITLLSCVLLYATFWLSIDYHPQKSYWHCCGAIRRVMGDLTQTNHGRWWCRPKFYLPHLYRVNPFSRTDCWCRGSDLRRNQKTSG